MVIRRPRALTAWLTAYAAATSTDASYARILEAATPGATGKPVRATVDSYREHLKRIFVLDPIPAWIPTVNPLFESLVTQSVRVYAESAGAHVGHLRTMDTTREIYLIAEGDDRRVVAIEVKLAATVNDHDVLHLHWLRQQIGDRLSDRVVITTGEVHIVVLTVSPSSRSRCWVRSGLPAGAQAGLRECMGGIWPQKVTGR